MSQEAVLFKGLSKLLFKLGLVWSLLEILLIDSSEGSLVQPHLHWISHQFKTARTSNASEKHDSFCEVVTRFFLQVREK